MHTPRANGHEQYSFFGVNGVVLSHRHIDGCFADSVRSSNVQRVSIHQACISHAAGNSDHFLDRALPNKINKRVNRVDEADNIDLEAVYEIFLENLGLVAAVSIVSAPQGFSAGSVELQFC